MDITTSLHKYTKTGAMTLAGTVGDNPLFVLNHLIAILRMVVLLSIWRLIAARHGMVGEMTLPAVLTYTLIAEVFSGLLAFRTTFAAELWNSAIVMRFLRPMHIFPQYIAEALAMWGSGFLLFGLPMLALAPLFGIHPLPAHPVAAGCFLLSLLLAISVGAAIELFFGSLVIVFGQGDYAINNLRVAITMLCSGAVLPLVLLPWHLGRILSWFPFAAMASAPLQIYTETRAPMPLLLLQAAWSVILWPLALWVWRVQRERLVTYGG